MLGFAGYGFFYLAPVQKIANPPENLDVPGYVYPPSYQEGGNGLVFNCNEKFWACVNSEAYFQCRDNMNWNAAHGRRHECYIANVYATELDCEAIQIYNTNTDVKTDFCNY
ncbi:MAG: hypothetical protein A2X86_02835 [Bdellovibrionales bacterium GWA2_49_15]|nr:MAG: hypothetical protein A2X86_02835 [Bdellovibrionales bacterium GWA2_49_15]HAZ14125.1 hypothetical protein [Bdellovibrionales bacterium]